MKLKNSFFYTLREDVKDEDSKSGNLLVRSGMIKKTSSGIYMFMPLGLKVLKNIENIVREEMNRAGANEVLMPSLVHEDIYEKSGRTLLFGDSVFSLKDRFSKPYVLGPTHEELFVVAGSMKIKSYKDMPFNIYQVQNKFRDEQRPRYGLIRVREFIMKDAYSFDKDLDGLDVSYKKMFDAYVSAFDRMKINYKIVTADTGVMGGLLSEEFQAITEIGEDKIVSCDSCNYLANEEVFECKAPELNISDEKGKFELIETKDKKTILEVSSFLNEQSSNLLKSIVYKVNGENVLVCLRGDRELNETKLLKILKVSELVPATETDITAFSIPGYIGPMNTNCRVLLDNEVLNMKNFIMGANKENYHYKNVNILDLDKYETYDLRNVCENDVCPKCGSKITFSKGIEIGNTFKLGSKYSDCLNLLYLDKDNTLKSVQMGCYGIGIGRCMAALAEQNSDEFGLVWPKEIAPFKASIVVGNVQDEEAVKFSNKLYDELGKSGINTILDDRDERIGVKFKDMDLIGIPYKIVVGRGFADGMLEVENRLTREKENILLEDIISYMKNIYGNSEK